MPRQANPRGGIDYARELKTDKAGKLQDISKAKMPTPKAGPKGKMSVPDYIGVRGAENRGK